MILPTLILETRKNQTWDESGIDTRSQCLDKKHFDSYPYPVQYKYNSRGFRDNEWSDSIQVLKDSIWCIGDSFTVGIGCPVEHTWPKILAEVAKSNTINVSLDGASNDWIARRAIEILREVEPRNLVIQWSFFHRSESPDSSLTDEQRRLYVRQDKKFGKFDDLKNFKKNLLEVETHKSKTNVIHSFVPNSGLTDPCFEETWDKIKGPSWPSVPVTVKEFNGLSLDVVEELKQMEIYNQFSTLFEIQQILETLNYVEECKVLDLARDGFHYDKITASNLVKDIVQLLD